MVWSRYRTYLRAPPELVLEWNDAETGARGWLVLNSLRGGAAGGGIRMRRDLTRDEVVYLAKTMELKFAFSGPPIGGAKSGIAFDAAHSAREDVLDRWLHAIRPFLSTCYGTGGDVNVDEQRDVVPASRRLGLHHPQEGVVRGHLRHGKERVAVVCRTLDEGLRERVSSPELGVPEADLKVSDLVTGFGLARAARRLYELWDDSLEGKRVIVEGFGNVGGSAALHLARLGARVVAIVDDEAAVIAPEGLDGEDVADLLLRRGARRLPEHPARITGAERNGAYRIDADVFVPAAVSGSVDAHRLEELAAAGVEAFVCGANQPFREAELGATEIQERADQTFAVVADVVGSLGMARAFHFLMEHRGPRDAGGPGFQAVFDAVARSAEDAVSAVVARSARDDRGLMAVALDIALDRLRA